MEPIARINLIALQIGTTCMRMKMTRIMIMMMIMTMIKIK